MIARRWVKVAYSALPNLILGKAAFPDLAPWESEALKISEALSTTIKRYQTESIRGGGELSDDLRALRDILPFHQINTVTAALLGDLEAEH